MVKDLNKRLLFICNQGLNRSPTAAEMALEKGYEAKSTGLEGLTRQDLDWSDEVIVMEASHRKFIADNFPKQYLEKKITVLDIPDIYRKGQPALVRLLRQKLNY